ncbi:hypothetical protein JOC77_002203 [Peribacillus deserti]|uniref:Uncharacterized protein n=1 Tax=Peribacillus deserti TaxID=673318 RepID=A0ABS2QI56_9BACI|nr:hypothetical protein [Peribacillus deserti]MBM7692772.1 hypothetical protein [Peribacillus deserti]
MAGITLDKFISELKNHAELYEIQIAIKHIAVFNVCTIKNYRFEEGEDFLMISSEDSRTNFQLYVNEILEIKDIFTADEIPWRVAAFTISCENEMEIGINLLLNK